MTTPTPEVRDEIIRLGASIYSNLQQALEAAHDRQYVAIHVDTGDYEVARTTADAMRAIRKRHPADGRLYFRKIGNEPEYSVLARMGVDLPFAARRP